MAGDYPWFRFYVEMFTDIEIRVLPVAHRWVWVAVLGLARMSPVAGVLLDKASQPVTDRMLAEFAGTRPSDVAAAVERFLQAGMLRRDDEGALVVSNWDRRQFENTTSTRRTQLHRNKDLRQEIRERDGDRCRYCGKDVNWSDRRGPRAGSYDHIDPRGANDIDNLVVACKACNSAKGSRKPEAAGMVLLLPRSDLDPDLGKSQNGARSPGPTEVQRTDTDLTTPATTSSVAPDPGGGVESVLVGAARLLAEAEAVRRGSEIGNPSGYVRARIPAIRSEYEPEWRRLLGGAPTMTAEQLVYGQPPTVRVASGDCGDCGGLGVIELEGGLFDDCPCKARRTA